MTVRLDETHDAALRSWVESANAPETDFPIQNLPFGVFTRRGAGEAATIGIAIGDRVLDLAACARARLLTGDAAVAGQFVEDDSLNRLMGQGRELARAIRLAVSRLLRADSDAAKRGDAITVPMADVDMRMPARIGDYTDFYASVHHATNVGSMFRPDSPLLPNYKYVPIGYHGRSSSILVSGAAVKRPSGQTRDGEAPPTYGPTRRMDYEIEVAAYVGRGNTLGAPVPLARAGEHLWGLCLLNDWSARDIQAWEYQPLGPFLAKNFATSVSPWVITLDALAPFRVPRAVRPPGDPAPLPHLSDTSDEREGAVDLTLQVWISSASMREHRLPPVLVSRGAFRDMYWTFGQMLTHHTSNGCNLRPGDLLASGTVSGPEKQARGCLLERTSRGSEPLELPTGERRGFLEDGDEVIMRGVAERDGFRAIGFGECRGIVLGAD